MRTKERDRLKVLHEVKQGHLTQGAAQQLGVTDRWVRKLLVRVKEEGDGGIVHRLRGKESNQRRRSSFQSGSLGLIVPKGTSNPSPWFLQSTASRNTVHLSKFALSSSH